MTVREKIEKIWDECDDFFDEGVGDYRVFDKSLAKKKIQALITSEVEKVIDGVFNSPAFSEDRMEDEPENNGYASALGEVGKELRKALEAYKKENRG